MHEGHRQRMYEKLVNGDCLYDHEILEILLYTACPRVNTNPVAHALLDRFCSLSGIFNADIEELRSVKGVGDNLARYLKTIALCSARAGNTCGVSVVSNYGDLEKFVSMRLKGRREEFLELYFVKKNGCITNMYSYTSEDKNRVIADSGEITKNVSLVKPYGVIIAHNHLNGSARPSSNDDDFTKTVQLICALNKTVLLDHVIYAGKVYSYKNSGRLDEICREYNLNSVLQWKKTSNST